LWDGFTPHSAPQIWKISEKNDKSPSKVFFLVEYPCLKSLPEVSAPLAQRPEAVRQTKASFALGWLLFRSTTGFEESK